MKSKLPSESDEQSAVIKWWRLRYPKYSRLLISSQSGVIVGGKNKFGQIAKLKKEGWQTGVPDLFLSIPSGGKCGLWIEMKSKGKTEKSLSDDQKEYLELLNSVGYLAIWCAGFDEAIKAINCYITELKPEELKCIK